MDENKMNLLQSKKSNNIDESIKIALFSRVNSLPQIQLDFSSKNEEQERGVYKKKMLQKSKKNFQQTRIDRARSASGSEANAHYYKNIYEKSFSVQTPYSQTNDDSSSGKLYFLSNQQDQTYSSSTSQSNIDTFTSQCQGEQSDYLQYTN